MTEKALVAQAQKAIKSLIKYESGKAAKEDNKDKKTALLEDEDAGVALWLVFGLDKVPEAKVLKPKKITVSHPWKEAEDELLNVCLITKDPHKQYKETVQGLGLKSINKVMGVTKLRTDYKAFETRRQLCAAYDVFLADERVLPLLPKLLGKTFFDKKKLPIPVDMTKKGEALKKELKGAVESTSLCMTSGPCFSVKIGLSTQTPTHLKNNVDKVVEQVIKAVPGGWNNIRTIHMKTSTSVSLPIYAPEQSN